MMLEQKGIQSGKARHDKTALMGMKKCSLWKEKRGFLRSLALQRSFPLEAAHYDVTVALHCHNSTSEAQCSRNTLVMSVGKLAATEFKRETLSPKAIVSQNSDQMTRQIDSVSNSSQHVMM